MKYPRVINPSARVRNLVHIPLIGDYASSDEIATEVRAVASQTVALDGQVMRSGVSNAFKTNWRAFAQEVSTFADDVNTSLLAGYEGGTYEKARELRSRLDDWRASWTRELKQAAKVGTKGGPTRAQYEDRASKQPVGPRDRFAKPPKDKDSGSGLLVVGAAVLVGAGVLAFSRKKR